MVTVFRAKTGKTEERGESLTEFTARLRRQRIQRRGLTKREKRSIQRRKSEEKKITAAFTKEFSPENLSIAGEKGSDLSVVKRRSGIIEIVGRTGSIRGFKPKGSKLVTKKSGEQVFQRIIKSKGKTIIEETPTDPRVQTARNVIISRVKADRSKKRINGIKTLRVAQFEDLARDIKLKKIAKTPSELARLRGGRGGVIEAQPKKTKFREVRKFTDFESAVKERRLDLLGDISALKAKGQFQTPRELIDATQKNLQLGVLGGVRGGIGVANIFLNPKQTAKGIVETVKNPKAAAKQLGETFFKDPTGTIAEFLVFNRVLTGVKSGVTKSGVGQAINRERFILSQPKNVRPTVRAILEAEKIQRGVKPVDIKKIKSVGLKDVKNLKSGEAVAIEKALRDTDSVIFGSQASRILTNKVSRVAKDVDIATKDVPNFNRAFINNLPKSKRANYIVKGEKVIRKSDNTALFDVKPEARLLPRKGLVTGKGQLPVAGFKRRFRLLDDKGNIAPSFKKALEQDLIQIPTDKIVKVKGVKIVSFSEQTSRKALGSLQSVLEKNFKRAKDPRDFIKALEIQSNSLKVRTKNPIKNVANQLKARALDDSIRSLKKQLSKVDKKAVVKKKVTKKKVEPVKKKAVVKKKVKKSVLPSKLPSKLPRSIVPLSKIPRLRPKPSRLAPSKLKPSKLPSKLPSKIDISKIPRSVIPPSKLAPSRLAPSKLAPSRLAPSRIPISKLPIKKNKFIVPKKVVKLKKKDLLKSLKKEKKKGKKLLINLFTPTLVRPKKPKKLLFIPSDEIVTGLEKR